MSRVVPTTGIVGVVAGRRLPGELLDARVADLRAGPMADRLPPEGSLEGRRLRRWVAQLVLTEELIRVEAARLGVPAPDPAAAPGVVDPGAVEPGSDAGRDRTGAGRLDTAWSPLWPGGRPPWSDPLGGPGPWPAGSLALAVLATMPLARALYRRVTDRVRVAENRARDYYRRNPELWKRPERRTLLHVLSAVPPDPDRLRVDGTWWTCTYDELPGPLAKLAFSAAPGAIVGPVNTPFGWHVCLIGGVTPAQVRTFDTVRNQIIAELTRSDRDRYFERWVEQRRSALVTTGTGCEHPGDPRHSDYAHHH